MGGYSKQNEDFESVRFRFHIVSRFIFRGQITILAFYMKVSLFIPCYIDQLYPKVGIATLELLEKLGFDVNFPLDQTCCGQPMANSGFENYSVKTSEHFLRDFENAEYIVSPSGSCVHHIKDHIRVPGKDTPEVSTSTYELSDFLLKFADPKKLIGNYHRKVGLHKSCHGLRGLKLGSSSELRAAGDDTTTQVLNKLSGIELLTPKREDECCGFGGTFAVSEEAVSVSMGQDRVMGFEELGVEEVTATDMSCLMHLEGIIKRKKSNIVIKHIAEILNQGIV